MTSKKSISVEAKRVLEGFDLSTYEGVMSAINALEDDEYLSKMGYGNEDTPVIKEVYDALDKAVVVATNKEIERRRKILYKACIKHLNPQRNNTGLKYFAWCAHFAGIAAEECDIANSSYELSDFYTKSRNPIIVDF